MFLNAACIIYKYINVPVSTIIAPFMSKSFYTVTKYNKYK